MKKFGIILDDTTIINFPFFWKLLKRYLFIAMIGPMITMGIGANKYMKQDTFYLQQSGFKNTSGNSGGGGSIASLLGEQKTGPSPSEIIGTVSGVDFQREFAIRVRQHENFPKLNLTQFGAKTKIDAIELLRPCDGDKECEIARVRQFVSGFVGIVPAGKIDHKYNVKVMTLDKMTTQTLTEIAVKLLVETRLKATRREMYEQLKVTEELSDKKKKELEDVDIDHIKDQKKSIEDRLRTLDFKIRSLSALHQKQKIEVSYYETKLNETKKTGRKKLKFNDEEAFKKRNDLEGKIDSIENDISAIRLASDRLSEQDKVIIDQLKLELKKKRRELAKLGDRGRNVASTKAFTKRIKSQKNYTQFDFNIIKNQFKKISIDFEKAKKEKKKLLSEIVKIDAQLEKLEPSFEYLKTLEKKIIQLKLISSTIVPDFVFDKERGDVKRIRKTTKGKVVAFSLFGGMVLMVVLVLLRFLFDDKIYDEYELEHSFEELTIIGHTPDFD
jgi:hypothetical protein